MIGMRVGVCEEKEAGCSWSWVCVARGVTFFFLFESVVIQLSNNEGRENLVIDMEWGCD